MMQCANCGFEIEFTRGKAYIGYVHADTGSHVCRGGYSLAEMPNYFDTPAHRQALDRYINDCGPEREDA